MAAAAAGAANNPNYQEVYESLERSYSAFLDRDFDREEKPISLHGDFGRFHVQLLAYNNSAASADYNQAEVNPRCAALIRKDKDLQARLNALKEFYDQLIAGITVLNEFIADQEENKIAPAFVDTLRTYQKKVENSLEMCKETDVKVWDALWRYLYFGSHEGRKTWWVTDIRHVGVTRDVYFADDSNLQWIQSLSKDKPAAEAKEQS